MKILPRHVFIVVLHIFYSFEIVPTSGQVIPIIREKSDNDDIGALLTILLLASQKNNGNCGCCSNCCGCDNKPIPYPNTVPPRSPLIRRYGPSLDYDYSYEDIDNWNNDVDANDEGPSVVVPDDVSTSSQVKNKQESEINGQTILLQSSVNDNKSKGTRGQKVDSSTGKASATVKATSGNKRSLVKDQGTIKSNRGSTKAASGT